MKNFVFLLLLAVLIVSCKNEPSNKNFIQAEDKTVVFEGISTSINPGDNFFDHVNKTWYDEALIADDQVGVGSYRFLNIPQQELLQNILDEVSKGEHALGSIEQ